MKIYEEKSLSDFTPWAGAVDMYNEVRDAGLLDTLEAILEDLSPDGMSETQINDLLWFEPDLIAEWLGLTDDEDDVETEDDDADLPMAA